MTNFKYFFATAWFKIILLRQALRLSLRGFRRALREHNYE